MPTFPKHRFKTESYTWCSEYPRWFDYRVTLHWFVTLWRLWSRFSPLVRAVYKDTLLAFDSPVEQTFAVNLNIINATTLWSFPVIVCAFLMQATSDITEPSGKSNLSLIYGATCHALSYPLEKIIFQKHNFLCISPPCGDVNKQPQNCCSEPPVRSTVIRTKTFEAF